MLTQPIWSLDSIGRVVKNQERPTRGPHADSPRAVPGNHTKQQEKTALKDWHFELFSVLSWIVLCLCPLLRSGRLSIYSLRRQSQEA